MKAAALALGRIPRVEFARAVLEAGAGEAPGLLAGFHVVERHVLLGDPRRDFTIGRAHLRARPAPLLPAVRFTVDVLRVRETPFLGLGGVVAETVIVHVTAADVRVQREGAVLLHAVVEVLELRALGGRLLRVAIRPAEPQDQTLARAVQERAGRRRGCVQGLGIASLGIGVLRIHRIHLILVGGLGHGLDDDGRLLLRRRRRDKLLRGDPRREVGRDVVRVRTRVRHDDLRPVGVSGAILDEGGCVAGLHIDRRAPRAVRVLRVVVENLLVVEFNDDSVPRLRAELVGPRLGDLNVASELDVLVVPLDALVAVLLDLVVILEVDYGDHRRPLEVVPGVELLLVGHVLEVPGVLVRPLLHRPFRHCDRRLHGGHLVAPEEHLVVGGVRALPLDLVIRPVVVLEPVPDDEVVASRELRGRALLLGAMLPVVVHNHLAVDP
mmetsp:Transcript_8211/g.20016  ORF Transcript_8211/g.20016 Transcript_8211/m.20016 type:complete len:439 (-) Transcript_8211:745-2061(-)